jgi:hypothetical protein
MWDCRLVRIGNRPDMNNTRKAWLVFSVAVGFLLFAGNLAWDLIVQHQDRTVGGSLIYLGVDLVVAVIVGQVAYSITTENKRG